MCHSFGVTVFSNLRNQCTFIFSLFIIEFFFMTDTKIDHHCTYLFVQKGRALYNLLISFTFNAILVILLVSCFSSDTEIALV